jgi:hypothetical protein
LIDVFNPLFNSVIDGSYIPYIIQSGTPGTDQQGYAWIEIDASGRPISIRTYYNGHWRRVYNGMLGEVRMFGGNPNDTTVWDGNGAGVIGGIYDGWQICNGKNGSLDLSDRFVVGGTMNNIGHPGYDPTNAWQTFVDGKTSNHSGGFPNHLLTQADLPPFNSIAGTSDVVLSGHGFKADVDHPGNPAALVDTNYGGGDANSVRIGNYGSSPNPSVYGTPVTPQTPVPTLPPYLALAFIQFVGYTT